MSELLRLDNVACIRGDRLLFEDLSLTLNRGDALWLRGPHGTGKSSLIRLAAGLLRAGLIDRLAWFHAPAVMGADGHPAAEGLRLAALAAMPRFRRVAVRPLGADLLTEYEPIAEVG